MPLPSPIQIGPQHRNGREKEYKKLLHLSDFEHRSIAYTTITLYRIAAIGHLLRSSIFHLNLCLTLHAVSFYHGITSDQSGEYLLYKILGFSGQARGESF